MNLCRKLSTPGWSQTRDGNILHKDGKSALGHRGRTVSSERGRHGIGELGQEAWQYFSDESSPCLSWRVVGGESMVEHKGF